MKAILICAPGKKAEIEALLETVNKDLLNHATVVEDGIEAQEVLKASREAVLDKSDPFTMDVYQFDPPILPKKKHQPKGYQRPYKFHR